jgi:hypothetical protein
MWRLVTAMFVRGHIDETRRETDLAYHFYYLTAFFGFGEQEAKLFLWYNPPFRGWLLLSLFL